MGSLCECHRLRPVLWRCASIRAVAARSKRQQRSFQGLSRNPSPAVATFGASAAFSSLPPCAEAEEGGDAGGDESGSGEELDEVDVAAAEAAAGDRDGSSDSEDYLVEVSWMSFHARASALSIGYRCGDE